MTEDEEVSKRKKELEKEDKAKKGQEKLDAEQLAKAKEEHPDDKITRANAAAERIEKATAAAVIENNRAEQLAVARKLGGDSEAGQAPTPPKEETPEEYKNRVMAGIIEND